MRVQLNDTVFTIPSSLSEFTLGQRIAFYQEHGKVLDQMAESVIQMEEGLDKDLEISHLSFEKMFRTFAFFANTTVEAIRESSFLDEIANIYYSSLAVLFEEENNIQLQQSFIWKGEEWQLHPPELKNESRLSFGEFIESKQLIKDMSEMGKGKWEYMLPLCAIYFRKKDEAYNPAFLYEGSERMELMKELPMDFALQVGFFLTGSLNMWLNTSRSFTLPELKDQANIVQNISTVGAG